MIAKLSTRLAGKRDVGKRLAGRRCLAAALFGLALVCGAVPAMAQIGSPAPALPQVSPAALLLAKQIVQAKDIQGVYQPLIRGVVKKARDVFLQTNFMYQKDIDEVAANVDKQFEPRVSELVDATAHYYAAHFTEQELRDLLAFYTSPLGKKALVEEPKVVDQSMEYAGNWGDNLSNEVIAAMRAELRKRGHDM